MGDWRLKWSDQTSQRNPLEQSFATENDILRFARALHGYKADLISVTCPDESTIVGDSLSRRIILGPVD